MLVIQPIPNPLPGALGALPDFLSYTLIKREIELASTNYHI